MAATASRIKDIKRLYHGALPIYKPAGTSSNDIIRFLNSDLKFHLNNISAKRLSIKFGYASILEPFASGVLTLLIGNATRMSNVFLHAEDKYYAKVKFGEHRETYCIDGSVIGHSSFDHLNEKLIMDEASKFQGITKQDRPNLVPDHFIFDYTDDDPEDDLERSRKLSQRSQQKYVLKPLDKLVECSKIELVNSSLPYAEFHLSCSGSFSVRQFVKDLAGQLNTGASLIELKRLQEGPFTLDDARTKIYQLHYEILSQRLPEYKSKVEKFLSECVDTRYPNDAG